MSDWTPTSRRWTITSPSHSWLLQHYTRQHEFYVRQWRLSKIIAGQPSPGIIIPFGSLACMGIMFIFCCFVEKVERDLLAERLRQKELFNLNKRHQKELEELHSKLQDALRARCHEGNEAGRKQKNRNARLRQLLGHD